MKKMRKILHEILDQDLSPGEVLRSARIEAGISQDLMEEITGIKRTNISAIENGRLQMTSHYAEIFAAALGMHPADLLYPNRVHIKSQEILKIEKRAKSLLKKNVAG